MTSNHNKSITRNCSIIDAIRIVTNRWSNVEIWVLLSTNFSNLLRWFLFRCSSSCFHYCLFFLLSMSNNLIFVDRMSHVKYMFANVIEWITWKWKSTEKRHLWKNTVWIGNNLSFIAHCRTKSRKIDFHNLKTIEKRKRKVNKVNNNANELSGKIILR